MFYKYNVIIKYSISKISGGTVCYLKKEVNYDIMDVPTKDDNTEGIVLTLYIISLTYIVFTNIPNLKILSFSLILLMTYFLVKCLHTKNPDYNYG